MKLSKINVAVVGKIKKDHWRAAQNDYIKRLSRYTTFSLKEVRDHVGKGTTDSIAISKEGHALLKTVEGTGYKIALTIQGQQMDSVAFSQTVQKWLEKYGKISFIIGGPLGLSDEVLQASQFHLSLAKLTLPHELARIVLLEQLYRAATIYHKHNYHK